MSRLLPALLLLAALSSGGDDHPGRLFKTRFRQGDRFIGSNTVGFDLMTTVRQGDHETESKESVQRTGKYVDVVGRAGENGILEIHRTYNMLYTKVSASGEERPVVYNSPLKGRTVVIAENRRRRDVKLEEGGTVDAKFRRLAGFELDWRDIFPDDPVRPGDVWEADSKALARRLSTFFDSGNRSKMKVRYEEDEERAGRHFAKFYVEWEIEGMRDRTLYTKIDLAGDVYFDLGLDRVTEVDLVGRLIVRGATVDQGPPRIIKGEGAVILKTEVHAAPVEASAPGR